MGVNGVPNTGNGGVGMGLRQWCRARSVAPATLHKAIASGRVLRLPDGSVDVPIRDLNSAWRAACRRTGFPGRVRHDLRRTGARALRALGMGDRDIAEMCGWETQVMVSRYLGRDPAGVADRLRLAVAEADARTRTFPARSAVASGPGEK